MNRVDKFTGDNAIEDAGKGAIWILGIEPGFSKKDALGLTKNVDDNYSINQQLNWPFNVKIFKLLAVVCNNANTEDYQYFAESHQPFAKGVSGFFKGNLYPFAFNSVKDWNQQAKEMTGFETKGDYYQWYREKRLPLIKKAFHDYTPKAVIGIGLGEAAQFAKAVGIKASELEVHFVEIENKRKKVLIGKAEQTPIFVLPHLNYYANCLNSDESIQKVGELIRAHLDY